MTENQYTFLKMLCETDNFTCQNCLCKHKFECLKTYLTGVKSFPLKKYSELTRLEKLYVAGKTFPMTIEFN